MRSRSMPAGSARSRTGVPFYGVLVLATLLTTLIHEAAHWGMGVALGHAMAMTLNQTHAIGGAVVSLRDALWIDAAGPAITIAGALIAFALIQRRGMLLAYPFLFAAWFMRFAAAFVSLSHPNDEARISLELLGGLWWLPGIVVLVLLALTWSAARRLRIGWKTNVVCYLICSLMTASIVFGDRLI
jgi:hypothetical protein